MSGYWHGHEWRWHVQSLEARGHRRGSTTIAVIERADKDDVAAERIVPFGFGIRDGELCGEAHPDTGAVCAKLAGHQGKHTPGKPVREPVDMPLLWEGDDG